jgi:membrane-associated protein
VSHYIDVILIGAVLLTLIPTLFHLWQQSRKAKKANAAGAGIPSEADVTLDPGAVDDTRRSRRH